MRAHRESDQGTPPQEIRPHGPRAEDRLVTTANMERGARAGTPPALAIERERIAQELNRYTVHRLFGIGLKLQALSASGPDSAISDHLDDCVRELDLAISDLRAHIFNLGPGKV
jgi:signal transduction histidine kinase